MKQNRELLRLDLGVTCYSRQLAALLRARIGVARTTDDKVPHRDCSEFARRLDGDRRVKSSIFKNWRGQHSSPFHNN